MRPASGVSREASELLKLALPIIGAQMTFMGMGVVDTIMAGRLGGQALAAVAVGANVWMPLFVFLMGLMMAVSPIVAQASGAGRAAAETGAFVRIAVVFAAAISLPWFVAVRLLAAPVIAHLGLSADTAQLAVDYLLAESWAAPGFALAFALRYGMEGIGRSRPILFAGLVGFVVNAVMDYALMYGAWGFPNLGAVGCGWAMSIASTAMALVYAAQYALLPRLRALQIYARGAVRAVESWTAIPKLGVPIGLILVAEAGLFAAVALLMARFGDTAVAAHQVAINFAALSFMVPLGLGLATTVRVGQAAGAGLAETLRLRGQVGIGLGAAFSLLSASVMGFKPEWITALYTEDAEVAAQAQILLRWGAVFQVFDCVQATANGALRGLKDTRMPMLITVAAYWLIGMPVAAGFAFWGGFGPPALWWGLIAGLAVAAVGLTARFYRRAGVLARVVTNRSEISA